MKLSRALGPFLLILCSCIQAPGGGRRINSLPASSGGSTGGSVTTGARLWSSGNLPLTVYLSSEFSLSERTALKGMGDKWNSAVGSSLTLLSFPSPTVAHQDKSNMNDYLDGRIETHKVYEGLMDQGTLAVTVYMARQISGRLYMQDADILFNYYDHDFSTSPSGSEIDLETVYLHELGHLVGMVHVTSRPSIMQPTFTTGSKIHGLNFGDQTMVKDNYIGSSSSSPTIRAAKSVSSPVGQIGEGDIVIGYMEARINGECRHFQMKKLMLDESVSTSNQMSKLKKYLGFTKGKSAR